MLLCSLWKRSIAKCKRKKNMELALYFLWKQWYEGLAFLVIWCTFCEKQQLRVVCLIVCFMYILWKNSNWVQFILCLFYVQAMKNTNCVCVILLFYVQAMKKQQLNVVLFMVWFILYRLWKTVIECIVVLLLVWFMYRLWKTAIECALFCCLFDVLAIKNSNWMWFYYLFDVQAMKNNNWMCFVLLFVLCTYYKKQ